MTSPIKLRNTVALLVAIALMSIGLLRGISSDLHVPAARILVAECQGFEALATSGARHLTCDADLASMGPDGAGPREEAAPALTPQGTPHVDAVTLRSKV